MNLLREMVNVTSEHMCLFTLFAVETRKHKSKRVKFGIEVDCEECS